MSVALAVAGLTGCERTEDDLERWRNAKTGIKKMKKWAASPDEPMAVRGRALEILLEEYEPSIVRNTLQKIDDQQARQKLETRVVEKIEKMWATKDYPTINKLAKKRGIDGGTDDLSFEIPLPSEAQEKSFYTAVKAKDAAFFVVQAIDDPKLKQRLQSILAAWLSEEWRLRNQTGKVTLAQIVPHAGSEGKKHALKWLEQTDELTSISGALLEQAEDDAFKGEVATVLVEQAKKKTPKVPDSLAAAVIKAEHPATMDFLKKAIREGYFSPRLLDASMNTIRKVEGPRSTDFFVELIKNRKGALRWAAVNDLIKTRESAGVISAAVSLPLEADAYANADEGRFQKDANWFGNFVASEAENWDGNLQDTVTTLLDTERWPARVLGIAIVKSADLKEMKSKLDTMSDNSQVIPVWGTQKTVGELAADVASTLGSDSDDSEKAE